MKVGVIGGGAVGSFCTLALADAGYQPEVFERFEAPNRWGAHSGESRLLRSIPYLETGAGDQKMLEESVSSWRAVQERTDRTVVNLCGGIILAERRSSAFRLACDTAAERSGGAVLEPSVLAKEFPQFEAASQEAAVVDPDGGLADPQEAVAAALELAVQAGAHVRTQERITAVRSANDYVSVESESGQTWKFDRVVVAAGAFIRDLLPELPVRARRLLLGWFRPKPERERLLEGMPSFAWSPAEGGFLYGGPAEEGRTVKIGIDAAWGSVDDPCSGRYVDEDDRRPMEAAVADLFPWLDVASGRYEMHIDGWSSDYHGILGPLPESDRIIVATGWSGHGFKIAPILGEIAAKLAVGGAHDYDISHLSPARFG